jgi:hypothetical protein
MDAERDDQEATELRICASLAAEPVNARWECVALARAAQ